MRKRRLSRAKQDRLIEHFVSGSTAPTVAVLVGVNRNATAAKVPVSGHLKRGGRVDNKIVSDIRVATSMAILEKNISPDSIVLTDPLHRYNGLDKTGFSNWWHLGCSFSRKSRGNMAAQ